ncbi:24.1 kDa heat shock protein, mitochondrial-like [Cornus florida]|uniref:24.1 kDa heat shock protein, mitochondrial-like n=1 Tax=Cornus florida TaxID=4283 RepID=UPI002899B9CA|nr:24.1 kDa heat shock protein, mitochondrial-like [Cornus florida]
MASLRPLTTASRLFSMSLRRLHHHRHTAFSPAASRSFCTGYPFKGDHTQKTSVAGEPYRELKLVNGGFCCIRFDVPGLTTKDLSVWMDDSGGIRVEGKCQSEPKYEEEGRFYGATIPPCPMVLQMDQVKAELKHGVLWITIPLTEHAKEPRMFQMLQKSEI